MRLRAPPLILFGLLAIWSPAQDTNRSTLRFRVVPNLGFTPDTGWRLGATARWTGYDPGSERYRWALRLDLTGTTLEQFIPAVELDLARLPGLRRPWRLLSSLRIRVHPNEPFTGFGNSDFETGFSPRVDPSFYTYGKAYGRLMSTAFFPLRGDLHVTGSQWTLAGGLSGEWGAFAESRSNTAFGRIGPLFVGAPIGSGGGAWLGARLGLLYDSRDVPLYARRGVAAEIWWEENFGPVGPLPRESRRFTAAFKFYLPFLRSFVLANRLTADLLFGEVPFFMEERTGGERELSGPGGVDTLRGMPLHRVKGPAKAIMNTELRFHIPWTDLRLFKAVWQWELALFTDNGRVWQAADPLSFEGLHTTYGGSLRLLWGRDFVVTLELAWWRGLFGGTYFTVGQAF
ncbi:MAG: hypothetical protein J0L75_11940 [Spirochaetes bacterium]|nr:hypothetical protein [Spirochaetota bacterium]